MSKDIKVVELFAGVGGFRIGLERASENFKTIWNNQWEPSTKKQDASIIYQEKFGTEGHCNKDINLVSTNEIPNHDLLVGGFPCQDYSVAALLSRSGGIEGKKGVLWWQIYRILNEKGENKPNYLILENVDRLINSPSSQRGRDFAIILSSLSDLGYIVEWRIINAAEYGFPQRRKRTYIVAYQKNSLIGKEILDKNIEASLYNGIMAQSFPYVMHKTNIERKFIIEGNIKEVSDNFNKNSKNTIFEDTGIVIDRQVYTLKTESVYNGKYTTLGDILINDDDVPCEFFIKDEDVEKWEYAKGPKKFNRISKEGFEYVYSEGGMAFPDFLNRASRTIITGEGGAAPSRFKHIIKTQNGRYRRLTPIELERLNMFPDNHTKHNNVSDIKRAFLMGNALVCGIVTKIGETLNFLINK